MQVLYQLSYGPKWYAWRRERWSFCLGPEALPGVPRAYNAACPDTWRHTATSRPCTFTWSAGRVIGA